MILKAELEVSSLQRRVQLIEDDLEKTEERLNLATTKLNEASQAADDSDRYLLYLIILYLEMIPNLCIH